jgi:hypothetical protein
MNRSFGGTYHSGHLLAPWFLASLIFVPDDGGDTFLRNVGSYTSYRALYLTRWLKLKINSVAWVRERNIPTQRPPLSEKLALTFEYIVCHVVSVTDPYGHILAFLDRCRYPFFQVASQLYSRGWVDSVPDPPLLRKSGSAGNRNLNLRICSQELRPLDHRGCLLSST